MKIAVTGEARRVEAFCRKLNAEVVTDEAVLYDSATSSAYQVIADFNADERTEVPSYYSAPGSTLLLLCSVKKSLAQLVHDSGVDLKCAVSGINALPPFLENSIFEVSFFRNEDRSVFEQAAAYLSLPFLEVQDRVGMVTPRVIGMIINEACYTLQEGTATKEDIDKAMKLGTNYPYGPFEWCDRIGIKDVYETLEAVWNDTHDQRYKICPLLKAKYLKEESFYELAAT